MTVTALSRDHLPAAGRSVRTVVTALLLAAAVALGCLIAGATPASAHAALTASTPVEGAVTDSAPEEVTLTFSEGVALSDDSIRVLDPQGERVDTGTPRDLSRGGVVRYGVALHSGLPDGTFTVAWQAVSADSHPVSGAFTFSVGAPSETSAALPDQQAGDGTVGLLYDIARYAAYAGFLVLAGGGAFVLACWPRGASVRPVQRLVVRGWITLTAATFALLLLRGPYTGSGKFADVFDLAGLRDVLDTKPGVTLVSRLLLLAVAALFVAVLFGVYARRAGARGDVTGRDGSGGAAAEGAAGEPAAEQGKPDNDLFRGLAIGGAVVSAGLAATWALAEHASTGIQPQLAIPVDIVHLLAVAAWLGGLATLLVALYRGPAVERAAVRRFSRLAFGSVLVLAATGLYQSWRQVGSWDALTSTSYGQLLLFKIALVTLLVGLARFSRRWTARLSPDAATGGRGGADGPTEPAEPAGAERPAGA
ncbi:MAG TPA: hypothetical protein DEQ61_06820, partial [Streptomyces sp.]|nr:hypothetical protein [Streptomyces sp.]